MNTAGNTLKLGTTLYSLTTEFYSKRFSFEELVRKVASENIGPGLEVVGFQSIKGFPVVCDEFAAKFKDLLAETALIPTCLGVNTDLWINPNRPMSEDENVQYHERQLEAAAKLGFTLVRYQLLAGPSVIERCLPCAERLGVKMGLEIHAPHHAQHPDIIEFREMYERVGSPMLGFIPDFGSTSRAVPPSFLAAQRAKGVPDELIALSEKIWLAEGKSSERKSHYIDAARAQGFDEHWILSLAGMFSLFGRAKPESWMEIMPQVIHIHGKFFDFDEQGDEVSVDMARILPLVVESGYDGFMSSEYEGHIWSEEDGFEKIKRHHALARRILSSLD
ncbi:sugar phosphate isomerase/epimerase [Pseudomaricurvus alcaniphilus]|uniref:sugar phosphate isomerase/epimerase family protein n=1 Tax=Pseudomaricurvus alcaniphilus TaxID=1166482 RepID=UPI00140DF243|nr:TIM barrel protein [Pseudomaricurvus alcaniphilus]NHN36868.1 sugar phosphate isomerase/epimerase [Pseudomaricurvus alcaniphilus]